MIKEKLTLRKSLEICKELWEWMRDNDARSSDDKPNWPGWKKYGAMVSYCPCCEYASQKLRNIDGDLLISKDGKPARITDMCQLCPLTDFWREVRTLNTLLVPTCTDYGSPYRSFSTSYISLEGIGTKAESQKMVEACEKALAKLGDNDEKE
jgi:hypothetical protein